MLWVCVYQRRRRGTTYGLVNASNSAAVLTCKCGQEASSVGSSSSGSNSLLSLGGRVRNMLWDTWKETQRTSWTDKLSGDISDLCFHSYHSNLTAHFTQIGLSWSLKHGLWDNSYIGTQVNICTHFWSTLSLRCSIVLPLSAEKWNHHVNFCVPEVCTQDG